MRRRYVTAIDNAIVHGDAPMTDAGRAAVRDIVRAVTVRMEAEASVALDLDSDLHTCSDVCERSQCVEARGTSEKVPLSGREPRERYPFSEVSAS